MFDKINFDKLCKPKFFFIITLAHLLCEENRRKTKKALEPTLHHLQYKFFSKKKNPNEKFVLQSLFERAAFSYKKLKSSLI